MISSPAPLLQEPDLIKTKGSAKVASVSLADCLACSGCVTSAETVLLEQQSVGEFEKALSLARKGGRAVMLSISPQSLASLSHFYGVKSQDVFFTALRLFLRSPGVDIEDVFSMELAMALALEESYHELRELLLHGSKEQRLPLLSSECPGWVCYAEKTQGVVLFPHMSRIKAP